MAAKAVSKVPGTPVIVGHAHAEMELDIGCGQVRIRLEEAATLGDIGSDHSYAVAAVAPDFLPQLAETGERHTEIVQAPGTVAECKIDVILEILTNAGRMVHNFNAKRLQFGMRYQHPIASAVAATEMRRCSE